MSVWRRRAWVTSVLSLCDPMDCSPPGSPVHGILQARIWSGLPCPSPGDLSNPGVEQGSPALQAESLPAELPGKPKLTMLHYNFLTISLVPRSINRLFLAKFRDKDLNFHSLLHFNLLYFSKSLLFPFYIPHL